MKRTIRTSQDGLGAVAIITIVALLAVGGAVAYEVSTNDRAAVETDTEMAAESDIDARATATAELATLKARTLAVVEDLRMDLTENGTVDASTTVFADIKSDIAEVYATADVETKAELDELKAHIASAEAQVRSAAETTATATANVFANIMADIEAALDLDASADMKSESTTTGTDASVDVDAEVSY